MAMSTAEGDILMVRPSYGEDKQNPEFIQVTVGYHDPRSALLTDAALNKTIQAAQAQMKPEYDVMGTVERITGGVCGLSYCHSVCRDVRSSISNRMTRKERLRFDRTCNAGNLFDFWHLLPCCRGASFRWMARPFCCRYPSGVG